MIQECPRCGKPFVAATQRSPGRPRRWCSQECRRLASEERRAAEREGSPVAYVKEPTTLDEHVRAVLDSPGACRRVLRALADRESRHEFADAKWSSVATELTRLRRAGQGPRWRR